MEKTFFINVLFISAFVSAVTFVCAGCRPERIVDQESVDTLRVCLEPNDRVRLDDGRIVSLIEYASFKHRDYATNGNRKVVIDWNGECSASNLCRFCSANPLFETVCFALRDCDFKHYDIGKTIWPHESCFVVRLDAQGSFAEQCWRLNQYAVCDWEKCVIEHGCCQLAFSSRIDYEQTWIDRRIVRFVDAVADGSEFSAEALILVLPSSVGLDELRQSIAFARRSWHKEIYITDAECGMSAWKEQVAVDGLHSE